MAIERADWGVDFGFAKLVKVAKEFQDVSSTAPGEGKWGPMILQVLPKGVPVTALLVLVAA